jgi:hypothetical protein
MPQANPFVVLLLFFIAISGLHYVMRQSMYETAIRSIMNTDKFKRAVNKRCDKKEDKDDVRE